MCSWSIPVFPELAKKMFHLMSPTEYTGRSVQAAVVLMTLHAQHRCHARAGKGHRTVQGHANHLVASLSSKEYIGP